MINVIGLGYIGLPTSLMLAANGNKVVGTDVNTKLVQSLNEGNLPFIEKGLEELFTKAIDNNIIFTTRYETTDFYIIAVPSPYDKKSKKIDVVFIMDAVREVLNVCANGATIVIESTISPGTIDRYIRPFIENDISAAKKNINLAHAPERIIPGNMIYELIHNSRTIGADDKFIANKIKNIYATFCDGAIVTTTIRTAEMTKVVENTFRDINIAYANELTKICRREGMNVHEIIRIANMHPRVNILSPGPGVGGHCISVDPWFLVGDFPDLANLIWQARKINDSMPEFVLGRINEIMMAHSIKDVSKVGLYGLTYKENVDDIRESPTLQILDCMKRHLASGIKVYDPLIRYDIVDNQYHSFASFLEDVEFVVIMVGHSELQDNLNVLNKKIVLDTRKIKGLEGAYLL